MLTDIYKKFLFDLWQNGDNAVAHEVFAEDVVDHNALPGQPTGVAGQIWAADAVRRAFPDLQFTLDVCFENGDLVTGRWTMHAHHTGTLDLLGIPATGWPVEMSGMEIFRVANSKIVEVWHAEDIGKFQRDAQLTPPPMMLKLAAKGSARKYKRSLKK